MKHLLFLFLWFLSVSFLDNHRSYAASKSLDLSVAEKALKEKRYEKVVSLLSPNIEKLDRRGLLLLGKAYSGVGNNSLAIKSFTAILAINPKDAEAKTLIGTELYNAKSEREAIAALKEALEFNNKYIPAYRQLIKIYESRKKENRYELRLIYQDLIEKIGETSEFVTKVCELSTLDSLYDLAFKYCQRGVDLFPKEARNHVYLGLASKDTGKLEQANKILKNAAEAFPKSDVAQVAYAQFLAEYKNYIGAYAYYKKGLAANKDSIPALLGLGSSALEIQKYQESIDALLKACLKDKKNLPKLRAATNIVRTSKNKEWVKKFEAAEDKCGG